MKYIENQTTWNLFLEAIDSVLADYPSPAASTSSIQEFTKKELEAKAKDLAAYSYKEDVETKQISEMELEKQIREGKLFNSHIFIRLEKHFYLEEKVMERNKEKPRELMQALHWFLCNGYYYKTELEVMKHLKPAVYAKN